MTAGHPTASDRRGALLRLEAAHVQRFLDERFDPPANGERRFVQLAASARVLTVRNFPLPDGFEPDFADVLLFIEGYPAVPPAGVYVKSGHDPGLRQQLLARLPRLAENVWSALPGFTCFDLGISIWRYCPQALERGDNLCKVLAAFFAALGEMTGATEPSKGPDRARR